jgi:hypothetical protein
MTLRDAENGVFVGDNARVVLRNLEISDTVNGVNAGRGKVEISDSSIRDSEGSGVVFYAKASLKLLRSTVTGSGRGVAGSPVAISGFNYPPVSHIQDCTISGNVEGVTNTRARISRSTITENATNGLRTFNSRRPTIDATILSGNGTDCDGPVRSRGFNVVGTTCFTSSLSGRTALDLATDDPMLGPLADNGGPTFTHAPLPGSPALEHVSRRARCRKPDQRGVARLPEPCDVGAHEAP